MKTFKLGRNPNLNQMPVSTLSDFLWLLCFSAESTLLFWEGEARGSRVKTVISDNLLEQELGR